jgi:hypothetical protein
MPTSQQLRRWHERNITKASIRSAESVDKSERTTAKRARRTNNQSPAKTLQQGKVQR